MSKLLKREIVKHGHVCKKERGRCRKKVQGEGEKGERQRLGGRKEGGEGRKREGDS